MFKRILVATDGSGPSRRAIKRAVQLAKEQKAKLTGFYVGPPWQPAAYAEFVPPASLSPRQHEASVKKVATRYLGVVKKAAAGARVSCKTLYVMAEFPYIEIIKAAKRNRCDLIVMGSHGRRGISRLLLGSEASKVLAHSTIPVLVCR